VNSKIYRCGWCGHPTDKDGNCLQNESFKKAVSILETYGDVKHTHLVNGECCLYGNNSPEREMMQVTRDMASDAQDPSLEGQWVKW